MFVFLLPSDMGTILRLLLRSVKRKMQRAACVVGSPSAKEGVAAAAAPPTSHGSEEDISSGSLPCPCPASVRTRVASWTFSFASDAGAAAHPSDSDDPQLSLPLQPTRSVQLQSAHTKLHLYDLCGCKISDHAHKEEGHASLVARAFGEWRGRAPMDDRVCEAYPPAPSPSSAACASAGCTPCIAVSMLDASSVVWGHAVNSSAALRTHWAATRHTGLFIEADLRISPHALAARASLGEDNPHRSDPFSIDDVVLAHDPSDPGEPLTEWFATLMTLRDASASASASAPPCGLKLDFKQLECVAPTLVMLRGEADSGRLWRLIPSVSFLWLNADVLPGPGAAEGSFPPVDGPAFLAECTRAWPDTVLSVGWTTGSPYDAAPPAFADTMHPAVSKPDAQVTPLHYTHEHVSALLSLLSRFNCIHPLTFPVRASLVRASWERGTLQRLLSACPHHSLTVWTTRADQAQEGGREEEEWIVANLPRDRTFVDLPQHQ